MSSTKIASIKPFEGAPSINCASVFGASPKKPIIFRIPVSGERPITYSASLPEGLSLDGNIITGSIAEEGTYSVLLTAENAKGRCEKAVSFEIKEGNVLVTPLLGFTSWNAFGEKVTQNDMIGIAEKMVESGIPIRQMFYIPLRFGNIYPQNNFTKIRIRMLFYCILYKGVNYEGCFLEWCRRDCNYNLCYDCSRNTFETALWM